MKKIFNFFTYLKYDLINIKWPNSSELFRNLLIVLIIAAVFGAFIFAMDSIYVYLFKMIWYLMLGLWYKKTA